MGLPALGRADVSGLAGRTLIVRKLLFLVTEDWYFVSHRMSLARAAIASGFEVAVATRFGSHRAVLEREGIRTISFEISRRGMNPVTEILTVLRLVRLLRRERPDIVHNVALKPVVLGGLACRLTGIGRPVSAIAGMGFLFTGERRAPLVAAAVRRILLLVSRNGLMIVQNDDDARLLAEVGVDTTGIRLIRGVGVDLRSFIPREEPSGVPVAALVARLLRDKGIREFVQAADLLRKRGCRIRCVLIGAPDPGNPSSATESEINAWVTAGTVERWGHRADMPAAMAATHIVCLPSYREGFPKVLLEAAACGRAVVATDVPGCRDIVRHRESGLLVPPQDATALADAIEELTVNPALRREMGATARRLAVAEFSDERVSGQVLKVYAELLQGFSA